MSHLCTRVATSHETHFMFENHPFFILIQFQIETLTTILTCHDVEETRAFP